MAIHRLGLWMVLCAIFGALLTGSAAAESKARIVRLSEVQGDVQMDRGDGFEKAFLNMPVIEGSRLKTGDEGRAEIEFEDGSALRIVPNSEISFTHLALDDDGRKLSTVQFSEGTLYANIHGQKGDHFTVNFGSENITLAEPAHFRIDLNNDEAVLAVFKGKLDVNGQSGPVEVSEKHSATFDVHSDRYEVAKNFEKDPYDDWDKQQSEYHDRYGNVQTAQVSSPYAYGWSDLNYYGNYMMVPGYGMVWQPYFIDASWNPYMDGGWMWYPGYGYMWVSAYPWGWMPYRYGNWAFVNGYGWVWQPGYWNTWYPVPRVVNPPARTVIPQPPVRTRSTVMVGRGLAVNPGAGLRDRVRIEPGSAGLGVPRGTVRNLDRIAREVNRDDRSVEVRTERGTRIAPPPTRTFEGNREAPGGRTTNAPSAGNSGNAPRRETAAPRAEPPRAQPPRSEPPRMSPPPSMPRMPSPPPAPPARSGNPR